MRKFTTTVFIVLILAACVSIGASQQSVDSPRPARLEPPKGVRLEDIAWPEAEQVLGANTVVVIPLGAGAKEHGPHLRLRNDLTLAEYLTQRVVNAADVVVAPAVPYHHYPAFLEYPGSTSLTLDTARTLITDIVKSLSQYGPRRFYVLNTGISTLRPLQASSRELGSEGILLGYTDLASALESAARQVRQQDGGSHADEIETSMMLYIDPDAVDMKRAVKEYSPSAASGLPLTRRRDGRGAYSASGVWGDPTLATPEKGRVVTEALVQRILDDIDRMRRAVLPRPGEQPAFEDVAARGAGGPGAGQLTKRGCTPQDERAITQVGDAFTLHWSNQDAKELAALWSRDGDIFHPDGTIETGSRVIFTNRSALFLRKEYRGSKHPLVVRSVRCLTPSIAVADGKWELRGLTDESGKVLPTFDGQVTLVMQKTAGWLIEAYRYTNNPSAAPPPRWFKRPGLPDKTP